MENCGQKWATTSKLRANYEQLREGIGTQAPAGTRAASHRCGSGACCVCRSAAFSCVGLAGLVVLCTTQAQPPTQCGLVPSMAAVRACIGRPGPIWSHLVPSGPSGVSAMLGSDVASAWALPRVPPFQRHRRRARATVVQDCRYLHRSVATLLLLFLPPHHAVQRRPSLLTTGCGSLAGDPQTSIISILCSAPSSRLFSYFCLYVRLLQLPTTNTDRPNPVPSRPHPPTREPHLDLNLVLALDSISTLISRHACATIAGFGRCLCP